MIALSYNRKGFSLIEILVTLILVSLLFAMVAGGTLSSSAKLDEGLSLLERSILFGKDESTLRHSLTRLHFLLDKSPQEFALEFGPEGSFVLPEPVAEESYALSSGQREQLEAQKKDLDRKFNRVKEFQDKNNKLPDGIVIVGVSVGDRGKFLTVGEPSFYFYPNGDKDPALIVVASAEEVIGLGIGPYEDDITRYIRSIDQNARAELQAQQEELGRSIWEEWSKQQ